MSISHYKREQSELCRHLSRLTSDEEIQARLLEMADEYMAKAAIAHAAEKFPLVDADLLVDAAGTSASPRSLAHD
jgi:hypothetical protein